MDSYDYASALSEVLPSIAAQKVGKGGFMVLRPDSGDPTEAVLMALVAADRVFGSTWNGRGYKVVNGAGVIQGDGIDVRVMAKICGAVEAAGFSAESVVYGMGGGLLQKVNRDTMSFATKLNHIVYANGKARDCMKQPLTDAGKFSLPGALAVKRVNGVPTVFPKDGGEMSDADNLLRVVYDKGPVAGLVWDDFDAIKARARAEWDALPLRADNLSDALKTKINAQLEKRGKRARFTLPTDQCASGF
jgi:nicotinamide phosphoribosyltransferase